jgi:hypothetical protein
VRFLGIVIFVKAISVLIFLHAVSISLEVFSFALLHSNAGARLHEEISLLPLSLQPFNLHHHEGHDLQGPADVNPADATNTPVESFLQDIDQVYAYDEDSSDFFGLSTDLELASGGRTGAQSSASSSLSDQRSASGSWV